MSLKASPRVPPPPTRLMSPNAEITLRPRRDAMANMCYYLTLVNGDRNSKSIPAGRCTGRTWACGEEPLSGTAVQHRAGELRRFKVPPLHLSPGPIDISPQHRAHCRKRREPTVPKPTVQAAVMGMKYVAAYLMAALAGKESPSAEDIKSILESVESEYDESIASKLVSELEGKVVHEVVAAGKEKLKGFGGGGGGGPVAAAGGGAAAAGGAAEKKEEKKVVEEEEEEEMEFDLFG
eukprot:s3979_g4.t2